MPDESKRNLIVRTMAGIGEVIKQRRVNKDIKEASAIIDNIDTIVRETINSEIISSSTTAAITRSNNLPNFTGKAITGVLKKRFAPDRQITSHGIYTNRYNMSDMYVSYRGENLVKFSVDKYAEAVVRNGYYIKSKNQVVTQYLNKRIKEMVVVSKSPFEEYIKDFVLTTILYGNTYSVKHRQVNASSGKPYRRWDGKMMKPIASLYVEDPRKMLLGEGPASKMRYVRLPMDVSEINFNALNPALFNMDREQILSNNISLYAGLYSIFAEKLTRLFSLSPRRKKDYIVYDEDEIDHVRYHHVPGEKIAMPPFYPTLNDIDSLRRIEENVELLVFEYGHPLLHAMVGDDKKKGDPDEINEIYRKIQDMESNGFIVTDNRALIKMIGSENEALRLDAYLLYFYRRVLTGLWLSEVTVGVGDTANRSTANTLDKLSQEKVLELQKIFIDAFQRIMIELLQEGGAQIGWILRP